MSWRETTVMFEDTPKDDPLGKMKIRVQETPWNIVIIFEAETSKYTDALMLPVNIVTKAVSEHLLEPDLILGATEDIGPVGVEDYRMTLISVAHQLSLKAGVANMLALE